MGDIKAVWLAFTNKAAFVIAEKEQEQRINNEPFHSPTFADRLDILRRGLWYSALITLSALVLAVVASYFLKPNEAYGAASIIAGTAIILWSTLALRGWDIQTGSGKTLVERVNLLIFRGSYFVGTFLIVYGTMGAIGG